MEPELASFRGEASAWLRNTIAACVTSELAYVPKHPDLYLSEAFFMAE